MDEAENRFPTWLSATMESRRLSQAGLARAVGVTDAQVSRWRSLRRWLGMVRPRMRFASPINIPTAPARSSR